MNSKTRWLTGLIALLIIANIGLVVSMWLRKDPHNLPPQRGADAKDYLVKTLQLDEEQLSVFDSLRQSHFRQMNFFREEMRRLKDDFFSGLNQPRSPATDSIAQRIGALQSKIDLGTFDHFYRLRSLLKPGQAKKFDNVVQDVLRTMGPKAEPGRAPPLNEGGPGGPGNPAGPPPQ